MSGTCGVVVLVNLLDSWESSSAFKLRAWLCVKHVVEQMRRNEATKNMNIFLHHVRTLPSEQ